MGFKTVIFAEATRNHPDRLIGVGSFDPYCKQADAIFKNLTERLGFKALKFELSEFFDDTQLSCLLHDTALKVYNIE